MKNLNFSKAFDKVDHKKLLLKLDTVGVSSQVIKWVQSPLVGHTQTVVIDRFESTSCAVTSGVPQSSIIGPILFLDYINDLPDVVLSKTRLFADNYEQLQKDLTALQIWESDWNMEFNPLKCKHVKISRKRTKGTDHQYSLHNIIFQRLTV